jgi:hypothetical protein
VQKLKYSISYLLYYFRSKTKFQIHSPFVYDIVTKVIEPYTPTEFYQDICPDYSLFNKYDKFIFRLFHFLKAKTIIPIGKDSQLTTTLQNLAQHKEHFQEKNHHDINIDVIQIISIDRNSKLELDKFLKHCHNQSVVIVEKKHLYPQEKIWQYLKNHPETTLSIDMFKIGMVFFRKEQTKQHFLIRF